MPNVNLIQNIGLGVDGTHTNNDHPLAGNASVELTQLLHPTRFYHDIAADIYTQTKEFKPAENKKSQLSETWKKIKATVSIK